jgi:hypothetical protein
MMEVKNLDAAPMLVRGEISEVTEDLPANPVQDDSD